MMRSNSDYGLQYQRRSLRSLDLYHSLLAVSSRLQEIRLGWMGPLVDIYALGRIELGTFRFVHGIESRVAFHFEQHPLR
jgi:hypothetical protein